MSDAIPERWLPVVGYEGLYEVSDHGRVRSLDRIDRRGRLHRGRVLKPAASKPYGHLHLQFSREGVIVTRWVHQLVAQAFHRAAAAGPGGAALGR